MKNRILFLAGLIACLFCTISCSADFINEDDDEYIWDIYPIELYVSVSDASGANLLDENTTNNILNQEISVVYDNQTYELVKESTRTILATFDGVKFITDKEGNKYIYIGQFDGTSKGTKDVTLKIGEKSYALSFDNFIEINGANCNSERNYYLNGQKVSGPTDSPKGMISVVY